MPRHATPFALTLAVLLSTVPVHAQQIEPAWTLAVRAEQPGAGAVLHETVPAPAVAQQTAAPAAFAPVFTSPKAPSWFMAVHAVTAGLQALDARTTIGAMRNGAYEVNPLLAPLASNRAALWATKAAVASGVIYATHGLARRHRVAAALAAIAVNGAYAAIVAHNIRVARTVQPQ